MLTKDSFPLTHFFFMLPNTEKYGKQPLHNIFHQNKRSINAIIIDIAKDLIS